ncbi:vasotab-like isoform X2 [Homalodisca vitripennis]|uniref:vasotab-like isoform X2 n=1 Tax=Homalodisca vitripennis TaxID=197043 RepID=UPI001EEA4F36|nr:vasotab-like isoform X2 [Homalodisca vitripennis]
MMTLLLFVIVGIVHGVSGQTDCPKACTREYNPVCGCSSDGTMTFSNYCEYNNTVVCLGGDYTILRYGQCNSNDARDCNCRKSEVCPLIEQFVCAYSPTKGCKSFGNSCLLRRENCINGDYVL